MYIYIYVNIHIWYCKLQCFLNMLYMLRLIRLLLHANTCRHITKYNILILVFNLFSKCSTKHYGASEQNAVQDPRRAPVAALLRLDDFKLCQWEDLACCAVLVKPVGCNLPSLELARPFKGPTKHNSARGFCARVMRNQDERHVAGLSNHTLNSAQLTVCHWRDTIQSSVDTLKLPNQLPSKWWFGWVVSWLGSGVHLPSTRTRGSIVYATNPNHQSRIT